MLTKSGPLKILFLLFLPLFIHLFSPIGLDTSAKPLSALTVLQQFTPFYYSTESVGSPSSLSSLPAFRVSGLRFGFPPEQLRSFSPPGENHQRRPLRTRLCIRPPCKISTTTCRSSCKRFARRNLAVYTSDPVAEPPFRLLALFVNP